MLALFEQEGMSSIEISSQALDGYIVTKGRGFKDFAGTPATFVSQYFVGSNSALSVSVAAPTSDYPTPEILALLGSIQFIASEQD